MCDERETGWKETHVEDFNFEDKLKELSKILMFTLATLLSTQESNKWLALCDNEMLVENMEAFLSYANSSNAACVRWRINFLEETKEIEFCLRSQHARCSKLRLEGWSIDQPAIRYSFIVPVSRIVVI